MLEVSTEARFGIRGKIGGVLFVDGGNVWRDAVERPDAATCDGRSARASATTRQSGRCGSISAGS